MIKKNFLFLRIYFKAQKGNFAFTLAEILVTLMIIGVIAALTIPALISNSQKQMYAEGLKKAYTNFSSVSKSIQADYNSVGKIDRTGLFDVSTTNTTLGSEIVKYFKIAQNCDTTGSTCWENYNLHYDGSGNTSTIKTNSYYKFVTVDGMSWAISNYSDNCTTDSSSAITPNPLENVCFMALMDVNGYRGPNRAGRDVFVLRVTKDGSVYVAGTVLDSSTYSANCNTSAAVSTSHTCCAGKIQAEGWEMNY